MENVIVNPDWPQCWVNHREQEERDRVDRLMARFPTIHLTPWCPCCSPKALPQPPDPDAQCIKVYMLRLQPVDEKKQPWVVPANLLPDEPAFEHWLKIRVFCES